ncbi:MAG: YegP family protein [Kangiella sp.]|nr:YegP family protein [Kangiella sp.]
MAGKFVISKGKDGKLYFVLKAGNGETILQSQGYSSQAACENGIESVRKNSLNADRFSKETAKDGRFYFTLNATNGQQIGKSQMYKSESGRNNGIVSVAKNAQDAKVETEAAA